MHSPNTQSGFTIIELIVTILVVGIVAGFAVPSFRGLMANARLTTTTNDLIVAMSYARSLAIRRALAVTVSPNGGNWEAGWNVVDPVPGGNNDRVFNAPAASVDITALDGNGNPLNLLRFDSRGLLMNQAGNSTITICDDRINETGRQIQISVTGRPNLNRLFACP